MKQEMKSTARLAVTAGLCTSLALGGLPLEAIAVEVVVEPVQAAAATAANATEDSGEGLTSSDPTPADDAAADEGAAEDDGAAGAGDDAKGEAEGGAVSSEGDSAVASAVANDTVAVADGEAGALSTPAADAPEEESGPEASTEAATAQAVTMTQDGGEPVQFDSVNAALEAAGEYSYSTNKGLYTIVLNENISEDVVIPAKKKVVIDLNGHKLTNVSDHTIVSQATRNDVAIMDSKGGGIVDSTLHGKAAIYVDANSRLKLSGGAFMRSAEASVSSDNSGGNSYYVLKNYGTLSVEDGVTVKFSDSNPGLFSSLVGSGWQNAAAAEAGTNGEPKPSEAGKKATLNIKGGSFVGGQITVKNDDYGVLNISGGDIRQASESRYAVANFNDATISGGSISAIGTSIISQKGGDANKGTIRISNGSISSEKGNSVILATGGAATIAGGVFSTGSGAVKIGIADDASSVTITGGKFEGAGGVSNKNNVYAEGYGAVEDAEGNLVVGVTDPRAIVITADGVETRYSQLKDALKNAPAGSTVKLEKDIVAASNSSFETTQFAVTVDLNGHSIDGTAVTANKGRVLCLGTKYGSKPLEGVANTLSLVNSGTGGGEIRGLLPLEVKSGDSSKAVPAYIGEGVHLVTTSADPSANLVKLVSSAYLEYSDATASYFKSGGFRVTAADGDRIYGGCANAIKAADGDNPVVHLMNDYVTNETIYSGGTSATLDLGGHTYTYTVSTAGHQIVQINYDNVAFTIESGVVTASEAGPDGITNTYSGSSVVLDGVTVNVAGSGYGIVTNGGQENNAVVLRNSTLNVPNGQGIYFPSSGSVSIENSVITAKYSGVQMCAGDLTVTGADTKITVTGEPQPKTEGDGGIADGAAISIVNRAGYKGVGVVSIEDGTFTSANNTIPAVKAYSFNNDSKTEDAWAGAGDAVEISGGTFSATPENMTDLCAEGYAPVVDPETGSTTVELPEENRVAEIDGRAYPSVQEALDAAKDGQTVKLNKGVNENVVIAEGKDVVLDLNGCTLSGGTVSDKAALTNYGTVTIKDSSADESGRIIREDNGIPAYYVIDNQSTMTVESGAVYNNAGNRNGEGASLVRNAGAGKKARLVISGGRFEQENFIVIKNDDYGVLEMTGGTIVTSKRDGTFLASAVQNWGTAKLTGGEITGAIWTSAWDSNLPAPGTVIGGSVVIDGEITADLYSGSVTTTPKVEINGGTIKNEENGFNIKKGAELIVQGGSFDAPVDPKYCADGYRPVEQPDGSFGVSTEQSYTVKHLFEAVDSDDYVEDEALAKTETLAGTIGQDTAAKAMDVEGFVAQPVEQKTIAADGSAVVEIRYDRTRHTVSFDSKGGTDVTERTGVKYGAKAVEPADPTKEGSTFLGWYVSGTFNKFDFNAPVTEDIQLVAHWVLNTYAVTLDANGGEPIEPIEMSHGYELIEPTATRTGYKLTGWKDADGKDVAFPVAVTGDLKLTAQWKLDAPKVALTADKAEPGVHAGDTVTLTANPEHALGGVTYTYQWYKGREKIDGATEKTLEVSNRDGEYTVDVVAHDGRDASAAATSNSITLSFERQGVAVSFAQADVEKHANEIGTTFANGVTLRVRAVGDVSYESSDNAVATVDAKTGEVTIRGVGEATITAKVAETETHEAAEASYKLTVTDHDAGTWKTVKPATCAEAGEEQRVCGVCGEALETRAIEKLAHKASRTPATPATCTKDGNIEYWSCEACGKLFADAACTDEIERADTVVKATGHKLEAVAEVAATIDAVGTKAHYRCAACGELFLDAEGKQGVDAADLVIERLEAVTVTFDDCIDPKDDHVVVRIAKGGVVSAEDLPEDPQLAGYEFSGWFLYDAATGTWGDAFDPTAPVTSDLLVGAKWKKVDEGTGDSGSTEKPADKPAKPSDEPGSGDKDALVQTGDNAFVQIAAAFSAGVAAIGAGLFSRRRRNE